MANLLRWLSFNLSYFGKPPWETGISPPELLEYIAAHPPGRALDLGCGTGVNLETLARAGWQVSGIDFALPAVAAARRRLQRAGLPADIRTADVTNLPDFPHRFDLVFDVGCFFGLPPDAKIAYRRNLDTLLAPGGYILLYGFLSGRPGGFGMTEDEIAALAAGFELVARVDSPDVRARPSAWLTLRRT